MGIFGHGLPYVNMHELNLDWIIRTVKALQEKVKRVDGETFAEFIEDENGNITCDKTYTQLFNALPDNEAITAYKGIKAGSMTLRGSVTGHPLEAVFIRNIVPGTNTITFYMDLIRYFEDGSITHNSINKQISTNN